jgi:glutaredoxin
MRLTTRLLQSCRITFFSRQSCGLCNQAREVLSDVWDARPFEFKEVDIMKPEAKGWLDLYDFDVPVVSFPSDLKLSFPIHLKLSSISDPY